MKRFYIIIVCQILALILFISAHFLVSIYYYSKDFDIQFASDIALFPAIGLQILSILLLISIEVSNGK